MRTISLIITLMFAGSVGAVDWYYFDRADQGFKKSVPWCADYDGDGASFEYCKFLREGYVPGSDCADKTEQCPEFVAVPEEAN